MVEDDGGVGDREPVVDLCGEGMGSNGKVPGFCFWVPATFKAATMLEGGSQSGGKEHRNGGMSPQEAFARPRRDLLPRA
eukprot:6202264-Prorocentrum_lima.AAC.1